MAKKPQKKIKKAAKKLKIKKPKQKEKPMDEVRKVKVKMIGIGNGAGTIVADIASIMKRAKFVAANTDKSALSKLKRKVETFHFGQNVTGGFGTGMDVELGQLAAEKEAERIEKLLKDSDICILVACLGGGTGSGAAPVFAKISNKLGNLTYGIFTLPFDFEGGKKLETAKEGLEKLKPFINAISIVPNERIFKVVDKKLPLKDALSVINRTLAFSLEGLINTIYNPGIINIDFADLRTILRGRGMLSYLNRTEASGEDKAKKALQKILSNPLYPYDVSKAKRVLFNIAGSSDLSISEVSEISEGISNAVKKESKIIFGVSREQDAKKIEISLLAVGCEMKDFFPSSLPQKKIIKKQSPKEPEKKAEQIRSVKPKKSAKSKQKLEVPKIKKEQTSIPKTEKKPEVILQKPMKIKDKVRKNALQIQKAVEDLEQEIKKKEEFWETPAFLRNKLE